MSSPHFSVPWGAVYAADENGVVPAGPPLFGRNAGPDGRGWRLYSVLVSQTRFWACSTAQFVITRPVLLEQDKKLDVYAELGIYPEMPITINLGYADQPFSDRFDNEVSGRVFFGYIDTIKVKVSPKGIKVTVSCRDSMRFLIDNKFSGQIFGGVGKPEIYTTTGFDDTDMRPTLGGGSALSFKEVEDALREGAGPVEPGKPDPYKIGGVLEKHKVIAWLIFAGSNGGCKPGRLVDHQDAEENPDLPDPLIETSTRQMDKPQTFLDGIQGFNIMNRFPLEVIKHLGSLEAEPRELYADVMTGRISWRRRRTNRQTNPWLFTFLRPVTLPDGRVLQPNVHAADTDWSTVGTISEIIVINPLSDTQASNGSALVASGVLSVAGRLPDNRFFPGAIKKAFPNIEHFVRRTRYVFDDTITPNDIANARGLIDAMLRIWGKDLRAGTLTAPGNAKIRPGDAIQCWNLGFFDGDGFRAEAVIHSFTASGPNKGYRINIAFSERDEDRKDTIEAVKAELSEGNFYFNEDKNGPYRDANGNISPLKRGDNAKLLNIGHGTDSTPGEEK